MIDESIWKRTFLLTAILLGASVLWVGGICVGSLLMVRRADMAPAPSIPATAAPKPASSGGPARMPSRGSVRSNVRNG